MSRPDIRAVLFDLEGTLFASTSLLPGAAETVEEVRRRGLGVRFLTNIESRTSEDIGAQLLAMGLRVDASELLTPLAAAATIIGARPDARVLPLLSPTIAAQLAGVVEEGPYTDVVVGDCREVLSYATLDAAFRAVRAGAQLVALQRGRYYKRPDGDHVDTGAVVAALEYAADVTARVVGKPSTDFFGAAAQTLGLTPAQCVVVGDDATTDIAGGAAAGARTVQVRTGKYRDQAGGGTAADVTIDSVADLVAEVLG